MWFCWPRLRPFLRICLDWHSGHSIFFPFDLLCPNLSFIPQICNAQFFFQRTDFRNKVSDIRDAIGGAFPNLTIESNLPLVQQSGIEQRKIGTRFQINTPITNSANLLWGFDFTNEKNDTEESVIDTVAFDEEREVNIVDTVTRVPKFEIDNLGLFLEGNWDVSQKLILTGGLRYENIDIDVEDWTGSAIANFLDVAAGRPLPEFQGGQVNESDVAFNFGILYKLSSTISLYSNFSQSFTIPSLRQAGTTASEDINIFTIDEFLTPEKVDNYEIGVRGNWSSVQFTAAVYYNNTDKGQNLTVSQTSLFLDLTRTPQRNYGVEASLDLQPANTWSLGGTFTWMEGEGDLFPDDNRSWVPLSSIDVQPMKLTFYLENQTLPGWNNRLQLLYVTNRDRAFDEGTDAFRITGYTTVDFVSSLNTGFGKWQVGIENLLNHQYIPVSNQPAIGAGDTERFAAPGRTLSIRYFLNF
ncbi:MULTISPECIES: TonB-dependent receptor [unclassified Okeania]|uniref:TonB-dependent receptor n=1 Tax=unclassified Okeania TaxID=2634635 RepID=UPI0013B79ABE|nr:MULTISPECIES: TonB-dependent receptor [unclassified Okeania]NES79069.1 TonB-dependent receptor [Okeania sp. SIO1H4]NET22782.1 TonB-dependent receptor [Okeania sp. SIO1H5]NET79434.1 TonB-dependent receptor [Okeania sp. SIO1F9]NET95987.1 TonB-dependent receptor [Okeania sp. SIO1H2]